AGWLQQYRAHGVQPAVMNAAEPAATSTHGSPAQESARPAAAQGPFGNIAPTAEDAALLQLENDYAEYRDEQVHQRMARNPERMEGAIIRQLDALRTDMPEWFARASDTARRDVALGRLKAIIRESLDLPSLD